MSGSKMDGIECSALENNFLRIDFKPTFAQINETRANIFHELNEIMIDIEMNNSFNNLNNLNYINKPLTGIDNVEVSINEDSKEREQKCIQARFDHDYIFPNTDATMDLSGSNITKNYNVDELKTTNACSDFGNTQQCVENSRINTAKSEMKYDNQLHTESPFCEVPTASFSDIHMEDINSFDKTNPDRNNFQTYDYEILLPQFVVANDTTSTEAISVKEIDQNSELDSDGYNSSDFEFITENEAKKDGFIINYRSSNVDARRRLKKRTINEGHDHFIASNNQTTQREIRGYNNVDPHVTNHSIRQCDEYYHLFQGYHSPTVINSWQNKAIDYNYINNNAMLVEPEGVGFNMKVLNAKNKEKYTFSREVIQEAEDTFQKILEMYPNYNKKTKRRRLF